MAADGSILISTDLDTNRLQSSLKNLNKLVKIGIASAITALGSLGAASLKVGMNFEAAMSQVAATMGKSVNEIQNLTEMAKKMGATTKFTATQAAEALNYLALAGYNSEQSIAALPTVLNLASAGGMDLAYASDLVTDSMAALGLSMSELESYSDQMAKTSQKSNTNVAQLGEAILVAGGQAKLAGMNTIQMNTALGILADNGIKGAEGGTALRNVLKNLFTPTTDASDALKELGIETSNADGSIREAKVVFQDLNSALKNLDDTSKLKYMSRIFDSRTIAAGNALLKDSGFRWEYLAKQIENSEGAAAKMAQEMQNNLKGVLTSIGSALEGIGIQIYEKMQMPIKNAAKVFHFALTQIAKSLADGELSSSIDKIALGISDLVKSLLDIAIKAIPIVMKSLAGFIDIVSATKEILIALTTAFVAFKAASMVAVIVSSITKAFTLASAALVKYITDLIIAEGSAVALNAITSVTNGLMAIQQVLVALLSGELKLAAAAQWIWNAAMTANPIGLTIAGVTALTAALTLLVLNLNKTSEETKKISEESDGMVASENMLTDAIKENTKEYQKRLNGVNEQAGSMRMLADEIEELSKKENKSAEDKELLQIKIMELNLAIPELALAYDEESDAMDRNNKSINDVIAGYEAQLKLDEQLKQQKALRADAISLETELLAVQQKRLEIQEHLNSAEKLSFADKKKLNGLIKELEESEKDLAIAVEENATSYNRLDKEIIKTNATIKASSSAEEKVRAELGATQEQIDKSSEAYDSYAKHTQNAFSKISQSTALTADEMIGNLVKNQELVKNWADDLGTITERGLNEGLIHELEKLGPEGAKTIKNLANASEEQLQTLNEVYEKGGEEAVRLMLRSWGLPKNIDMGSNFVDDMSDGVKNNDSLNNASQALIKDALDTITREVERLDFPSIGNNIAKGIANGIENGRSSVVNASVTLANSAASSARRALQINSPSKVMMKIGEYVSMGLATGIEENAFLAENAATDMANSIIDVEIESTQVLLNEMEKRNKELSKQRDLADAELKIANSKNAQDRQKAEEDLNQKLLKIEEDALKERLALLKEEKRQQEELISETTKKVDDLQSGLAEALKRKYEKSFEVLSQHYNSQLAIIEESYNSEVKAAEDASDAKLNILEKEYASSSRQLEEYIKEREKAYESDYNVRISTLNAMEKAELESVKNLISTLDAEKSDAIQNIQDQIDSIDALTQAESKAADEAAYQKKLSELAKTLTTEENAEKRAEIQESIDKLISERARKEELDRRKEEKESLKQQISQVKASFDEQKAIEQERTNTIKENYSKQEEIIKNSYDDQKTMLKEYSEREKQTRKENYDNQKIFLNQEMADKKSALAQSQNNLKIALNEEHETQKAHHKELISSENLTAESKKLINERNQQEIMSLLETYYPQWREKGRDAGTSWLDGLADTESSIKGKVDEIFSYIDRVRDAQSSMSSFSDNTGSKDNSYNPPKQQDTYTTYTVKKNDNLSQIAASYGTTVNAIADANSLANKNLLSIGQILKIPLFDNGGIVASHMIGELAKNGKPEAIIPLDRLPGLLVKSQVMQPNNQIDQGVVVHFNNYAPINTEFDITMLGQKLGQQIFAEERRRGYATI